MAQVGMAIGLPFGGRLVHPKWALSLKLLDFPLNTQQSIIIVENQPIVEARNRIVESALEQGAKYLFFLDDDVIIPRQTIMGLGHILTNYVDEKVMVATGIYVTKAEFPVPVIFKEEFSGPFTDWEVNQIFDVDSCGAGCMLINTEVFQHLEKPYFREIQEYREMDGAPNLVTVSEDVYFCNSVRKAGFKIKAHGAILCPHYDNKTNKFYELSEDSLPFKRAKANQEDKNGQQQ